MGPNNSSGVSSAPPPVPPAGVKQSIALCRKCGRPIDSLFAYCPYCGQRQRSGDAWCYHPVSIAVLALFVLGPLALPLVWRSARMGRGMKLTYTVGILAYGALTIYYAYVAIAYELRVFGELGDLFQ